MWLANLLVMGEAKAKKEKMSSKEKSKGNRRGQKKGEGNEQRKENPEVHN